MSVGLLCSGVLVKNRPRDGVVIAVCRNPTHALTKPTCESIRLVAGLGVEGDAHMGMTAKHRSRVAADPTQPNLRQVHLIAEEFHDELRAKGFRVAPGIMGENITTRGIDLLALPRSTKLHVGATAVVEVTGLRNSCAQLNNYQEGLLAAVVGKDAKGRIIRKAGVMSIVVSGGEVRAGDPIKVILPPEPHVKIERV
jgi:MOSC domain-containing protein YiiM